MTTIIGFKSAELLKDMVDLGGAIADELAFEIEEDALSSRLMDPSHIALLDMRFPKELFETYDAIKAKFTLRASEIKKVADRLPKTPCSVEIEQDSFKISVKEPFEMKYTMHLLGSHTDNPLPKLNFDVKFEIDNLINCLKDINTISDHVKFEAVAEDKSVKLSGKSEAGEAQVMPIIRNPEMARDASATYSVDMLLGIVSKMDAEKLKVQFSEKIPIKITANLRKGGAANMYLAPRL